MDTKIDGTGKTQAFNPKVIDKITISETGEIVDRKKIFNLAGIEYTEKESETTDRETLPKPQKTISTTYNPCKDELYLKIKQKELDSMSDREYQYFLNKDRECSEFAKQQDYRLPNQTSESKQSFNQYKPEIKTKSEKVDYYIKGSTVAETEFTSLSGLGGLLCGVCGGLIGWGIGAAVIQGMDVDIPYSFIQELDTEEQYQFKSGYKETAKKIRKSDFNTGAGIGTAIIVVVLLASGS